MVQFFDEKGSKFSDVITKITIPATIQTLTHRIQGNLHIREWERFRDALNKEDRFLAITEATVFTLKGETILNTPFMVVNQEHVVWAVPEDDRDPGAVPSNIHAR
jgi:hypothetical protein